MRFSFHVFLNAPIYMSSNRANFPDQQRLGPSKTPIPRGFGSKNATLMTAAKKSPGCASGLYPHPGQNRSLLLSATVAAFDYRQEQGGCALRICDHLARMLKRDYGSRRMARRVLAVVSVKPSEDSHSSLNGCWKSAQGNALGLGVTKKMAA